MTAPRQSTNGYEALGKTVLFLLLLAISSVINGLVLTRLWAWFVAATFGIQTVSIAQAIGLALLARFLIGSTVETKSDQKSFGWLLTEAVVRIVAVNGFTLLLGLVVVQFT